MQRMRHYLHVGASAIALALLACAADPNGTSVRPPASVSGAPSAVTDPLAQEVESSAYQEETAPREGTPFVAIPEPAQPSPLTEQVDRSRPRPGAEEGMREEGAPRAAAKAAEETDLLLRAPGEQSGPDVLSRKLGRQGHDPNAATRAIESLGTGTASGHGGAPPIPDDGAVIIVPAGSGTPVVITDPQR